MSLGGSRNLSFNAAIASLVDRGITTVVAAGNSRTNACTASPASAPEAITVGATDRFDNRASFSNYGECVDVFAPGVSIPSANAKNYSAPVALSGTSMASPHVAGVAALILGESPAASTEQVESQIYALSQVGVVKNPSTDRGNRMAVSPPQNFTPIPTLPGAPTGLKVATSGGGFVDFAWNAVDGAKSYEVEYRKASQNSFTSASAQDESFRVSGLAGGEQAYVRVRAVTDAGTTKFSSIVSGKSAILPPSQVRSLTINATSKNSMIMSWQNPISLGGAGSVQYRVEMKTTGNWQSINTGPQTSVNLSDMKFPHYFRVFAFNEAGLSEPSAEVVFDPAVLFGVSSVNASAITGKTAEIAWTSDAPVSSSFEVRIARSNSSTAERTFSTTQNPLIIEGLQRLTGYTVTVTPLGEIRGFGASASFTTLASAPEAPRALSATKRASGFLLRFAAPADNGGSAITSYRLEQLINGAWAFAQEAATPEFTVSNPARGATSEYRLIAINAIGESSASGVLRVTTPAEVSTPPQSVSAALQADGRVVISWQAPADDGGDPVRQYRIEILRDGVWAFLTTLSNTTVSLAPIAKGTGFSYRVSAYNRAGYSAPSAAVEVARERTVPAPVTNLSSTIKDGQVVLTWTAPSDNGGSPILGYQIQQRIGSSWTSVGDPVTNLTQQLAMGSPGETLVYRVQAVNELGASVGGYERTVRIPFLAASAPRDFAFSMESNRIRFTWSEPESNGGSQITYYVISSSVDGENFRSVGTYRGTQTSALLSTFQRGTTSYFRIHAMTSGFGSGAASDALKVEIPAVAPQDPASLVARVLSDGVLLTWTATSNDGGSPVTGYRVEQRVGSNWNLLGETSDLNFTAPLGSAGESLTHRVITVTEVGQSNGRSVITRMGIAPATEPQSVSATVVSSRLQISWQAPETMGGNFSYYEIQRLSGGTFARLGTSRTTSYLTILPAAGQSFEYRVVAFTNAGMGAFSSTVEFANPKVVPSAPSYVIMRSAALTNTVSWRLSSSHSGGGTFENAVLYRDSEGVWVKVAEAPANSETLTFANDLFGTTQNYALRFTNEVGESGNSRVYKLRHAFAPTSEARNLALAPEGTRLRLSWQSPEFTGGSNPSYADIQMSTDGTTWRRATFIRYAESALVSMPAKGTSISYRVIVRNSAGESPVSESVSFSSPNTVPSTNFSVSAYRSGSFVMFRVTSPSDFGGYSEVTLRVEQQGTLAWQSAGETVMTRPRTSVLVSMPLPSNRGTYTYRIAIANPSGEVERTVTFRY
jgi:titin